MIATPVPPSSQQTLRVVLIDDHTLFRAGLAGLLEQRGIQVLSSVSSGSEGIDAARELSPDVILLDIRMPDESGLEILSRMRTAGIQTPVIMVTTSRDEADIMAALRCGAQGYLLKDMEPEDLIAALYAIMQGEAVIAPELAPVLARIVQGNSVKRPKRDRLDDLTPREREILHHLAEGQSNKAIARDLGISDGTVKLHVKSVLRKLNVSSRVEAAVIAVEQGLSRNA